MSRDHYVELPPGAIGADLPGGSRVDRDRTGYARASDSQAAFLKAHHSPGAKLVSRIHGMSDGAAAWVDCVACPRSTLRSAEYDESGGLCPRCRQLRADRVETERVDEAREA